MVQANAVAIVGNDDWAPRCRSTLAQECGDDDKGSKYNCDQTKGCTTFQGRQRANLLHKSEPKPAPDARLLLRVLAQRRKQPSETLALHARAEDMRVLCTRGRILTEQARNAS